MTLVIAVGTTTAVESAYESPPTRAASEIVAADLLSGEHHEVMDRVTNDGYLNFYRIASDYGRFEAHGNLMLLVRVQEIKALAELDRISKTEVFLDSLADAGLDQLGTVAEVITSPVTTVKGMPTGVKRLYERTKRRAQAGIEKAKEIGQDEPGWSKVGSESSDFAEGALGVSEAERRWAQKLGVDPYTSNEVLAGAIRKVAWVDRAGSLGVEFAPVPYLRAVRMVGEVNQAIWERDPLELRELNMARLRELGAGEEVVVQFFRNPWFSPTQQTLIIGALEKLEGVEDRWLVAEAAAETETEEEALFRVQSAQMAAWLHRGGVPLTRILGGSRIPLALTGDGRIASMMPVDYISWTEGIAAAAASYSSLHSDLNPKGRDVWFLGSASPRCAEELNALGWTVHQGIGEVMRATRRGGEAE
jgi:hypothetical protein